MLLCEIEGRVLGGMQFEVLVDAVLRARGHAVWGAGGCCFASLTAGSRGHAVWGAGGCFFASLTAGCWGACSLRRGWVPGARGHVWGAGGCCSRVTVRGWCIVMMFPRYGVWV